MSVNKSKRGCEGKIRFDSKAGAEAALAALIRKGFAIRSRMAVYQCKRCVPASWHYGHRKRPRR